MTASITGDKRILFLILVHVHTPSIMQETQKAKVKQEFFLLAFNLCPVQLHSQPY
ncbi:MAG: hypothetical protein H0X31_07215 [Nostocaceae cyanobacterium]|nr:hypothetical protein [Nostocaceae cyanobacterium]